MQIPEEGNTLGRGFRAIYKKGRKGRRRGELYGVREITRCLMRLYSVP